MTDQFLILIQSPAPEADYFTLLLYFASIFHYEDLMRKTFSIQGFRDDTTYQKSAGGQNPNTNFWLTLLANFLFSLSVMASVIFRWNRKGGIRTVSFISASTNIVRFGWFTSVETENTTVGLSVSRPALSTGHKKNPNMQLIYSQFALVWVILPGLQTEQTKHSIIEDSKLSVSYTPTPSTCQVQNAFEGWLLQFSAKKSRTHRLTLFERFGYL